MRTKQFPKFFAKFRSVALSVILCASSLVLAPQAGMGVSAAESYLWPTPNTKRVTNPYSSGHTGIDIGGSGAVVATKSGTVYRIYTGCNNYGAIGSGGHDCNDSCHPSATIWQTSAHQKRLCNWGYGNGVVIKHDDGSGYSMYAHMQNNIQVSAGSHVIQGDVLGYIGASGRATGAHLHFELCDSVKTAGTYDKPLNSINSNTNAISYTNTAGSNSGNKMSDEDAIIGYLDSCSGGSGKIFVGGWAIDQRIKDKYCEIDVYVNGQLKTFFNANKSRPDVNKYYGVTNCGFDEAVNMSNDIGLKTVDVYAVGLNGAKKLLGSKIITVDNPIVYANNIQMNKNELSLETGKKATLTATVSPSNASNINIKWESLDPSIATVSNGVVTAVGEGTTYINVTYGYVPPEGRWKDTCTVTVKKKDTTVYATDIKLNKTELSLNTGDKETLTATVYPENASNIKIKWESLDPSIATVNNGVVTAVGEGTTYINVTYGYVPPEGRWKDTCTVTVKRKDTTVYANDVKMSSSSLTLTAGDTTTITATVSPSNATDKTLKWTSSDTKVVTVNNGKITAVGEGTATVTASLNYIPPEGKWKDTCTITVNKKQDSVVYANSVKMNKSTLQLTVGGSSTLTATVSPSNATDKTLTWTSSNESVATVNNGVVTAVAPGKTTIKASLGYVPQEGTWYATCEVTVKETKQDAPLFVKDIKLDITALNLALGESSTLTATLTPSNAQYNGIQWSSDNTNVATVSNGNVKAVGVGTATITVSLKNTDMSGTWYANCFVTVKDNSVLVTGISLNASSLNLKAGETSQLSATISPSNATNKDYYWYSYDTNIATVENGLVRAIAPGSTTITAQTLDGGKVASCKVTVQSSTVSVTGLSLSQTSVSMKVGDDYTITTNITPSNATNKGIIWTSDNTDVAIVLYGTITARSAGDCRIVATSEDSGIVAICNVHVDSGDIPVTSVAILGPQSVTGHVGDVYRQDVVITPSNATNKNGRITSSNEDVALVIDGFWVILMAEGQADITVTTTDGGHSYTRTFYALPAE